MRNLKNLFSLKKSLKYEIIYIGNIKIFISDYYDFNQLKTLINYCILKDSILFITTKNFDLASLNEDIFTFTNEVIVIFLMN